MAGVPQRLEVIGGGAFLPGEPVVFTTTSGLTWKETADANGMLGGVPVPVTLPVSAPPTNIVYAVGSLSGARATAVYTEKVYAPTLTVSASSGAAGAILTVDGSGWLAGEYVTLGFAAPGGQTWTLNTTTGSGFGGMLVQVPSVSAGSGYAITAQGSAMGATVTQPFTVTGAAPRRAGGSWMASALAALGQAVGGLLA